MLGRIASRRAVLGLMGGAGAVAAASSSALAHAEAQPKKDGPASADAGSSDAPSSFTNPFKYVGDTIYDNVIRPYADPSRDKLLPDLPQQLKGRPTLVISLDGTLIESQWTRQFGWRYVKRPGVDEFLAHLAPLYELVLWTECQSSAETVIDRLDPGPRRFISHRLYRDATTYTGGLHRKDLSALNRDMDRVLIVDCDASAFSLQPEHGIAVSNYSSDDDPHGEDQSLKRLIPYLQYLAIAARKGAVGPFSEELQALGVPTTITDNGEAFSKAVEKRFADLKAEGKMPLARGYRGRQAAAGGAPSGTIWDRMRSMRGN